MKGIVYMGFLKYLCRNNNSKSGFSDIKTSYVQGNMQISGQLGINGCLKGLSLLRMTS